MGDEEVRSGVGYELTIRELEAHLSVREVRLDESLGGLFEGMILAAVEGELPAPRELLGRDLSLRIARGEEQRHLRGIVRHASLEEADHEEPSHPDGSLDGSLAEGLLDAAGLASASGALLRLHVVPAAWLLSRKIDTRINQELTAPEVVQVYFDEMLASREREIRLELRREYPRYEYLVQYRESAWAFLLRLLEREGIFTYFDHEAGEREVLVLADASEGLVSVREGQGGRVPFARGAGGAGYEGVHHAAHHEELGPTDAVVSSYDWTNPAVEVRGERTGRGEELGVTDLSLEVYDHADSVEHFGYEGGQYREHSADTRSALAAERLDLARQRWELATTVVTAKPGRIIEVVGSPGGAADRRYLIVHSSAYGAASAGGVGGSFENTLEVVPVEVPYRMPRATPRPLVPGPESAVVVGPSGEEIHTDEHGRIKVQFHWDRRGRRDEQSSCWLRVAQSWSGPGWGTLFLPRIGMEVIVSFLGGDPDRPIVTGCVYNGQNPPPYALPEHKTRSTLKSQSSPSQDNASGYNELRFEDKAGREEIYLHAEKDLNEVVEHDHSTTVQNDQRNTVHGYQTELVDKDQSLTVKENRLKRIEKSESTHVLGDREETVDGREKIKIKGADGRSVSVDHDDKLTIKGKWDVYVKERHLCTLRENRDLTIWGTDNQSVAVDRNVHVVGKQDQRVDGYYRLVQGPGGADKLILREEGRWETETQLLLRAPQSEVAVEKEGKITLNAGSELNLQCGQAKIQLKSDGSITIEGTSVSVKGGAAQAEWSAQGTSLSGPKLDASADGPIQIQGLIVKIN